MCRGDCGRAGCLGAVRAPADGPTPHSRAAGGGGGAGGGARLLPLPRSSQAQAFRPQQLLTGLLALCLESSPRVAPLDGLKYAGKRKCRNSSLPSSALGEALCGRVNLPSREATFPTAGKTMPPNGSLSPCHSEPPHPQHGKQRSEGRERLVAAPRAGPAARGRGDPGPPMVWGRLPAGPASAGSPRVTRAHHGCEVRQQSTTASPPPRKPPRTPQKTESQTTEKVGACVLACVPGTPAAPTPPSLRCNEGIDRLRRPQGGLNPKLD